jgi:hypothetical protein
MSNNKQQTPVEWFFMALQIRGLSPNDDMIKCYEEAKEMEKILIENTFNPIGEPLTPIGEMLTDGYYNETYGGE